MRKIHKKLDQPPKKTQTSEVECEAEYPGSVTDNWNDATCEKCQLNNPENKEENENS